MYFKFSSVKYTIFPYHISFYYFLIFWYLFLLEIHDQHCNTINLFIEKNIIALSYSLSNLLNNLKNLLCIYNSAIYLVTV